MKKHIPYFKDVTFYHTQWCSFAVQVIRNLKQENHLSLGYNVVCSLDIHLKFFINMGDFWEQKTNGKISA